MSQFTYDDFTGFSFNNIHSSQLGICRVSDGSRYDEIMVPDLEDKITEVEGKNGAYYWYTKDKPRTWEINIAFDEMTEEQFRTFRGLFGVKNIAPLIFDEEPYKVYSAKISAPPQLHYICFVEDGRRIYKGEGTISFIAYYPYAKSRIHFSNELDEKSESQREDWDLWKEGSGLFQDSHLYSNEEELMWEGKVKSNFYIDDLNDNMYNFPSTTGTVYFFDSDIQKIITHSPIAGGYKNIYLFINGKSYYFQDIIVDIINGTPSKLQFKQGNTVRIEVSLTQASALKEKKPISDSLNGRPVILGSSKHTSPSTSNVFRYWFYNPGDLPCYPLISFALLKNQQTIGYKDTMINIYSEHINEYNILTITSSPIFSFTYGSTFGEPITIDFKNQLILGNITKSIYNKYLNGTLGYFPPAPNDTFYCLQITGPATCDNLSLIDLKWDLLYY